MSEYKYGKSYERKNWDERGTRFRTNGTSFQMEVEVPLSAKEHEAHDFVNAMQQIIAGLIEPVVTLRTIVVGFEDNPHTVNEEYLVISGWKPHLNREDQQIATSLQYH